MHLKYGQLMKITAIQLLVLCLSSLTNLLIAQDRILLNSGEEIAAKVIEIAPDLIKYKRFANLEGPSYAIERTQVFLIWYENGEKDVFESAEELNEVEKKSTGTQFLTASLHREWSDFEYLGEFSQISLSAKVRPWEKRLSVTMGELLSEGTYSLIYFGTFDHYCPFCKYFLDAFSSIDQTFLDENDINVIFIAQKDNNRSIRKIPTNIDRYNWTVTLEKVYVDDYKQFFDQKRTTSYPNMYLVDKEGKILIEISSWRLDESIEFLENKIAEELNSY